MAKHFQKLKDAAKKKQAGRKRPKPKEIGKGRYEIFDVEHFREFFSELSHQFQSGDLLLFAGEVGAGKTEAIRALVDRLSSFFRMFEAEHCIHFSSDTFVEDEQSYRRYLKMFSNSRSYLKIFKLTLTALLIGYRIIMENLAHLEFEM